MSTDPGFVTEDSRWAAVAARDRRADGAFLYAVRTTGVYCRPGCASRLPKREHIEFFAAGEAAERAGYRPCRRCKPDTVSPRQRRANMVAAACQRIEASETPPTLDALAAEAGLSPWHFHRVFKATVGVTPKQYAQARRLDHFRDGLEHGNSVTEAIYGAGFGSSSRAYERVGERLGMTPSAYRNGAAGLDIRYAVAPCFLDWVLVAATTRGICAIEFGDRPDALRARLGDRFPKARIGEADADFAASVERVTEFIDAPERGLDLPLDIHGTAFQQRVWKALQGVPPGRTASYGEIAERIGNPKAVRAVAQACAANGIAVAIPCHRVVRSDGGLGGYRWGNERKRALLERESRT